LDPPVQQSFRDEIAISFLMILDWWPPVAVACGDDVGAVFCSGISFYHLVAPPGVHPYSGGYERIFINKTRSSQKGV